MNQRHTYRRRFPLFPLFALAAALLLGGLVMLLWNAILPALINVNPIKYWQSVGLLALCRILFGNFGGRMGGPGQWKQNWQNNGTNDTDSKSSFGRSSWRGKWMSMTEEERLKFRDEMRQRCRRKPPEKE
ncbi:hypothetical protein [Dyadobacter sp. NIV53]|uniref:hypothetical protein n=1 Tax=Dyadobacter sp. NIV53 TaxID=2861765 RepID=UPI001C878B9E|nr:hypothetical protein [Dyadobacter sp. NIV53]